MSPEMALLLCAAVLALLAWPRYGLMARWRRSQDHTQRTYREDVIKHILKSEANGRMATLESIAGTLQITTDAAVGLVKELESQALLTFEGGKLHLQADGRKLGLHLVRAHRLWESYLAEQTGLGETEWHPLAEKQEHWLTPQEADNLAARLGHPVRDPHGDAIPDLNGTLEGDAGRSLNSVSPETPVLITHLEDEPPTVYRQLVAAGLRPGIKAFVIEKTPLCLRVWANGHEFDLAPVLAENVSVKLLPQSRIRDLIEEKFLSGLKLGAQARVLGLSPACRSSERRRLLDLGFVAGTLVQVEMVSPGGDPVAYRVRGTLIALRQEQAGMIRVTTCPEAPREQ